MKAQDLRIGNLVDLYGTIATIQKADFCDCKCTHGIAIKEGKPIPLTEEWLLKLDGLSIIQVDIRYNCCKYVHQLQNLYHSLTGKELTINEN